MTLALPDDATVELDEPCDGDIRVRSEDLVAVLP
jgi:hypothetical protein